MKKIIKVLLKILCVVFILLGVVVYWQYDNISSLINGLKYSSEDLASQLDTNRNDLKAKVDEYTSKHINDLSAEDEQKLLNGEITIEDISEKYGLPLDIMTDDISQDNNETPSKVDQNAATTNIDNKKAIDDAISTGVSKMYALKAKYVSKLGEIERNVYNEYTNLPKEKQNEIGKKNILMKNLNSVAQMEEKCDNEVASTLTVLETELKKLNGDTEIVDILKEAYENEKEIKKSYYLSLYNN